MFRPLVLVAYACSLQHLPSDWEDGRYWPDGILSCKPFVTSFVDMHVANMTDGLNHVDRERLHAVFSSH